MAHEPNTLRHMGLAATLGVALTTMPALAVHAENGAQEARAVITIPNPQSANLLHLRGIGGRGTALLQLGGACYSLLVRFVAGDFAGRHTNLRDQEPIVLELRDAALVQALLNGRDIVSDETLVSDDPLDQGASIVLLSGLVEGTGFVINPGRNLFADIVGARTSIISCDAFNQVQAEASED